jgi:Protein of unknown function (DUF4100)
VVICSKTEQGGKRASPAYHFASELQEKVDTKVLYNSFMDKEVTIRLGDILGSSFKLCKWLQIATKTQCIPVKSATARSSIVETTVNSLECTSESISVVLGSTLLGQPMMSSCEEPLDSDAEVSAAKPVDLKPGKPKCPLINCPPKKPCEHQVNAVAFDLADNSDDNSAINDSDTDTDDLAEEYYRWQLEKEHNQVFNIRESDYSFCPMFLAMVTVKIQGTIMGQLSTVNYVNR